MPREPDLRDLQAAFMAWLRHGDPAVTPWVRETASVDRATRLAIYANAYRARLAEALADNYPALHTLLGDERFDALCRQYLDAAPSRTRSIRWFGDGLADFLRQAPDYRFQPVLAEMARFEWALRAAFDAADDPPLAAGDLRRLPPPRWPELVLRPVAALARLDFAHNVPALWQAIDQGADPIPVERSPSPVPWVVWRHDGRILFRSLAADEAGALDALCAGQTFTELCAGLGEGRDAAAAAQRAAALLLGWVGEGMLAALD